MHLGGVAFGMTQTPGPLVSCTSSSLPLAYLWSGFAAHFTHPARFTTLSSSTLSGAGEHCQKEHEAQAE